MYIQKLTKKLTLKALFFPWKPLELLKTENFADVQFVIDSCRFGSQSNFLNKSNKDCDWLISSLFIGEELTVGAEFTRLENRVWCENSAECVGKLSDSSS